jgi:pimeloyl-ACP methyl ester carboxylesterase
MARWPRLVAAAALLATGAALAGLAGWIAYTGHVRVQRETRSAESIAGGRGRWISAADAQMYVQEWGDPRHPTVLVTHGTGAWSGTWFELPGALAAAGLHVVAVDLPPFGLSRTPEDRSVPYSRSAQARRLVELMRALDRPVTLVGHSFGAGPALEAAMQGGPSVQRLVLVDPALGLGPNGEPPRCEPSSGPAGLLLEDRGVRTALVGATATWPAFTPLLLKQFVHRKEVVTEQLVPAYRVPFERTGFTERLGDWAVAFANGACESAASLNSRQLAAWAAQGPPVALIWGEQDAVTPLAQAHALQRWMPKATLTVLPGVGHIPHIESPQALAAALIRQLPPTAGR